MSQNNNNDPKKVGQVVVVPPGKTMPPITGYTPFWEKNLGLLYVPNNETTGLDLSVGVFVEFRLKEETNSYGTTFSVSYDISNF